MSAETDELTSLQAEESSNVESSKKWTRSYSRDFLLFFGESEVCKHLPTDFDESLLSEIHGTSYYGSLDRPRALGNPSSHAYSRTVYGSSPPTRGDSGSYSQGLQRWDSRSSGKSEADSDTDVGRRIGNQARRTWQNSEHDGLLGSGSFPKPPGFVASGTPPKFRSNENLQLNKSNEPYQPPRPYRAGPFSRRETKDSFNDETFGSSDGTSEDRAEEEKKRRAEFELMRKEHHKAFEENQKSNSSKPKDSFSEMASASLQENASDILISSNSDKVVRETPHNVSKFSVSTQAPAIRPLVPPGFVSGVVDKSSAVKSHVHADTPLVENQEVEHGRQNVKHVPQERGSSDWFGEVSRSSNLKANKDLSSVILGIDQASVSGLPGVTKVLENGESLGLDSMNNGHKMLGDPVRPASILNNLFDSQLNTSCDSTLNVVEGDDPKPDDLWSTDKLQSKFACWFHEEDKKIIGKASLEKPNSMLSLMFGGEKGESDGINGAATALALTPEIVQGRTSSKSASLPGEVPERLSSINGAVSKAAVLTCEDLEQSMLSEIGGDISRSRSPVKERGTFGVKKHGVPGNAVDNSASQRLLSLLQGGTSSNNPTSVLGLAERLPVEDQKLGNPPLPKSSTSSIRESNPTDKNLTLESLFGSAFMTELQLAQKTSVGSSKRDAAGPFPHKMAENGGGNLASDDGIANSAETTDWRDFYDTAKKGDLSRLPSDTRLSKEGSVINVADPIRAENSAWMPNSSSGGVDFWSSSSSTAVNIMENISAHSSARTDERSMLGLDPLSLQNPYDIGKHEMPYQNLHSQASFPQLNRPPMNQSRTPFQPLGSHHAHIDPHMKFISPDVGTPFPTNMGHPSFLNSSSLPTFNHQIPQGLQQMNMGGNHPPPHLARGFPGAATMPLHPSHTPGFSQEHTPTHGFPFGQRQPNFGGPGMTPSGLELGVGNSPPEALQRLLEMEMRANPKQMHPLATGGPTEAVYGHVLYR